MISQDAQQANIKAEQNKKVPFEIKVAKLGLEGLVALGCLYVAHKHGPEAAQYIDALMHSPEPLRKVMGFSCGEYITYGGTLGYMAATIGMIEHAARKRFGKLK